MESFLNDLAFTSTAAGMMWGAKPTVKSGVCGLLSPEMQQGADGARSPSGLPRNRFVVVIQYRRHRPLVAPQYSFIRRGIAT
jgi:hypothetical protein